MAERGCFLSSMCSKPIDGCQKFASITLKQHSEPCSHSSRLCEIMLSSGVMTHGIYSDVRINKTLKQKNTTCTSSIGADNKLGKGKTFMNGMEVQPGMHKVK